MVALLHSAFGGASRSALATRALWLSNLSTVSNNHIASLFTHWSPLLFVMNILQNTRYFQSFTKYYSSLFYSFFLLAIFWAFFLTIKIHHRSIFLIVYSPWFLRFSFSFLALGIALKKTHNRFDPAMGNGLISAYLTLGDSKDGFSFLSPYSWSPTVLRLLFLLNRQKRIEVHLWTLRRGEELDDHGAGIDHHPFAFGVAFDFADIDFLLG